MSATLTTSTPSLTAAPGFTRALTAVRGAELGLLRAVALDLVAIGEGDALGVLGPQAIEVLRAATGPLSVDLQAHATPDSGATTFLGRGTHGIAVSAHLSLVAGARRDYLRAAIRLVGTHGSVLVDLLRPRLDVRTAAGIAQVPYAVPSAANSAATPSDDATEVLSAIAGSARSGQTVSITW